MAIGASAPLTINHYRVPLAKGNLVLICSDGLHGVVDEDTIAESLSSNGDLQCKCDRLVQAARSAGGPDNITAVLIQSRNGNGNGAG